MGDNYEYPDWNPRYVEFASENGRTPEQQETQDKIDWPNGGFMTGFILWCSRKGYRAK